jgi:hypothetical protein
MSHDGPIAPRKERLNPWPDGPDRKLGLFPILTVGFSTKDRDIDCAINSAADEDLTPEERKDVVTGLEALVRHFREPHYSRQEG